MRKTRVFTVVVVLLAVVPLWWLAGEMHRQNCIREGRVECSILPWDSGSRSVTSEQDALDDAIDRALSDPALDRAIDRALGQP